jgi:two-component system, OmpR family, KDP operon response regulator KdpE
VAEVLHTRGIKGRRPTYNPQTAMTNFNPVLNLADPPETVQASSPNCEAGAGRKKIMIVEDETITLALTRKFLVEAGYEVVSTQDGGAAVSLAMAESPDLILLDLGLSAADPFTGPHFDGFIIMDWLHRMIKELKAPIIVVTAQTGPEIRRRVLDAGAAAFFSKPVNKGKLLTAIRIALEPA